MVPKLVAYRHKDDDLVEEVVKKAAKSNPLKLQQVGLNYDRAHLKASQWKADSETSKNKESTPEQEPKAPEEATKIQVTVNLKQAQSVPSVPSTEGSSVAENSGPGTAQHSITKEDEIKKEQSSGSTAAMPDTTGQEKQQSDVTTGPESEGEKDPDPVEQKEKAEAEDSEDEDESETSPWNAVCVIGLRVFSKDANLGLHLEES